MRSSLPSYLQSWLAATSGIVWDAKSLDEFLEAPFIVLPGTFMGFPGFSEEADRRDVIAYLQQASADPQQCAR